MGKKEGKIEKALVARVKAIGGKARKSCWIGHRGCPDRRLMLPLEYRRHLRRVAAGHSPDIQNPWVECKAPGEELADHQVREIDRMRELGELVLVIDSLDLIDEFFPLDLGAAR